MPHPTGVQFLAMTERLGKYEVNGVAVLQKRYKPLTTNVTPNRKGNILSLSRSRWRLLRLLYTRLSTAHD